MQFAHNVYITEPTDQQPWWVVRNLEPSSVPGGKPRDRKRRFHSKDEAFAHAARVTATLTKIDTSVVDKQEGSRMRLDTATALYREWLLDHNRTPDYVNGRIGVLLAIPRIAKVEFCDQISGDMMEKIISHYKSHADHGRGYCSFIKTFLRRAKKKFHAAIDTSALEYGADGEIEEADEPERPGVWTNEQITTILRALCAPRDADAPPSIGHGRGSPGQVRRALQTVWFRRRIAFVPLFVFLIRYGFRPIDASRLRVKYWKPEQGILVLPTKKRKKNKKTPDQVIIDAHTAQFMTKSCLGKDPDDYLFSPPYCRGPGKIRPKWSTDKIYDLTRRILKQEGLPGTSYWTRHTALTYLCWHFKGDLKLVAKVSGHTTISSLQRYLHAHPDRQGGIAQHYDAIHATDVVTREVARIDDADDTPPPTLIAAQP